MDTPYRSDFVWGLSKLQVLAQDGSSGVLHSRSGQRRITDVPARMPVHRRIPDVAERGAEGRSLTRLGH